MKNFNTLLLIASLLLVCTKGFSQYSPLSNGPYSGASGLGAQPAVIVDSRYDIDIMPAGFYWGIAGNYAGNLLSFDPSKYERSLQEQNNMTSYIQLDLLHAMIGITPRQSVGFGFRSRAFGAIGNASRGLLEAIHKDIEAPAIPMAGFYAQYHTFSELFASYAMMVTPKNAVHSFSVGATFKLTSGGSSSYLNFEDGTATYDDSGLKLHNNASGQIGRSESALRDLDFKLGGAFGLGADVGLVYEYRPNIKEHEYNMDGQAGLITPYPDKYLFKVSVALLDVGTGVKYPAENNQYKFTGNYGSSVDIHDLWYSNMHERALAGMHPETAGADYSVKLPMALNIAIDWNSSKDFYVNFNAFTGLVRGSGSAFYRNAYTLTPRYERTWYAVGLPVQLDQYSNLSIGLMLRLGPVWVGSQTLFTNLVSNKTKASDISVMVKIPFLKTVRKDTDNDGVSDRFDWCENLWGAWGTQGCPDTDGDGVPDEIDWCPYEAGVLALHGCPDKDGDGVSDAEDDCPDEAGFPKDNGCPDTDGDGIIDQQDECPLEAGPAATHGCPDEDGDGVIDQFDRCPKVRGVAWNFGCPEEYQHKLVETSSKKAETSSRKPVPLTSEEQRIVNNAFNDVNFETGNAAFLTPALSLNRLATLLKGHPDWHVIITGYTDNGSPKTLSEDRAIAGKNYLIERGVQADRITTAGKGDEEPVAANATGAGRQSNRRMVVTIVK
jgi:outer membrane protein OmpA-like peptidoglycan-associated protein